MSQLLKYILALLSVNLFGIIAVRGIGLAQLPDPDSFAAMLMSDSRLIDETWCWRDICPQHMGASQLWQIIDQQPILDIQEQSSTLRSGAAAYQAMLENGWRLYFNISDNNLVRLLDISDSSKRRSLSAGELIAVYGTPLWMLTSQQSTHYVTYLCFRGWVCGITISQQQPILRAWSLIQSVTFSPTMATIGLESGWRWRGFRTYP